jgi:hypothetical protein
MRADDPRILANTTRRRFLHAGTGLLAAALLGTRSSLAAPPDDEPEVDDQFYELFRPGGPELQIDLPQLQYAGDWNPRPGAMRELGQELRLRTRLAPMRTTSVVELDDDALFQTPFLYVSGRGGLAGLVADGQAHALLRRFVDLGGMIVFDDADGGADFGFGNDVDTLITATLPGSKLAAIPADHVLYRSFYIVDFPAGRTRAQEQALGVQDEGRIKILVLPNDLGGALARDDQGLHRWTCTPGGNVQREWAVRFAVNILLYATCTDYKTDRAHVETLLRNRQWR